MQHSVHEDRAKELVRDLDKAYHAFVRAPNKPWLNAEDKQQLHDNLKQSLAAAQTAVETIDAQPGISLELKQSRDKLVITATMAEIDLKHGSAPRL